MTLLSLLAAGYKSLQKRLDKHHTDQSMAHLDERLLADIGVCRRGNTIIALPKGGSDVPTHLEKSDPKVNTGCAEHTKQCCFLPDSGG